MVSEWDLKHPGEVILGLGYFIGYVGRGIDGFKSMHGE